MQILKLTNLRDLITHVLDETGDVLETDHTSFLLIDENRELTKILEEQGITSSTIDGFNQFDSDQMFRQVFGNFMTLHLGPFIQDKFGDFFPRSDPKPVSVAILPLVRGGKILGAIGLGSDQKDRFTAGMATDFLDQLTCVLSVCLENTINCELLRLTSLIDTLTGVNNRRFFDQRIGEEIDRAQRNDENLSCLFLDIDHFKSINDKYGHQAGDQVLTKIAAGIRSQLRNNDVLARYGGEEFVALLSGASVQKAMEVAERIRKQVETCVIANQDGNPIKATLSIGVSTFIPNVHTPYQSANVTRFIRLADNALYGAKDTGRNRVVNGGVETPSGTSEVNQA